MEGSFPSEKSIREVSCFLSENLNQTLTFAISETMLKATVPFKNIMSQGKKRRGKGTHKRTCLNF
jgi:hypothetical protein